MHPKRNPIRLMRCISQAEDAEWEPLAALESTATVYMHSFLNLRDDLEWV